MLKSNNLHHLRLLVFLLWLSFNSSLFANPSIISEKPIKVNNLFYPIELQHLDSVMPEIYNFNFFANSENSTALELAYLHYWKGLSGESLNENMNICLMNLTKYNPSNKAFHLAAQFLEFRVLITQNKTVAAAVAIRNIKEPFINSSIDTLDPMVSLYWGIYNYFVGYARKNYPVLKLSFVGWPEANMKKGLETLEQFSTCNSVFLRTEASYFLSRIYCEFENEPNKAIKLLANLTDEFKRNTIFSSMYLNLLKKYAQPAEYKTNYRIFSTRIEQNYYSTEQKVQFYNNLE